MIGNTKEGSTVALLSRNGVRTERNSVTRSFKNNLMAQTFKLSNDPTFITFYNVKYF